MLFGLSDAGASFSRDLHHPSGVDVFRRLACLTPVFFLNRKNLFKDRRRMIGDIGFPTSGPRLNNK